MSSRADAYRQRAADAKKRAAHAKDLSVKKAFEEVARGWLVLAEQMEWMTGRGLPAKKSAPDRRRFGKWKKTIWSQARIGFSPSGEWNDETMTCSPRASSWVAS